jgi:hypothetical protein
MKIASGKSVRRAFAAVAVIGGLLAAAPLAAGSTKSTGPASPSADISISQTVSNGSAAGSTTVTDTIHNAGPSTATEVQDVQLVKISAGPLGYIAGGAKGVYCDPEPAPTGWNFMFSCQFGSIASGATVSVKFTLKGTTGASFTRFASVGDFALADPRTSNNSSTLNSLIGDLADLSLSQKATAGTKSGTVTITNTVANHGPWTATGIQLVFEIKGTSLGVLTTGPNSGNCQFIPPSAGYNYAADCPFGSVAPGKTWVIVVTYTGPAGESLTQDGSISAASPPDPVPANNKASTATMLHA